MPQPQINHKCPQPSNKFTTSRCNCNPKYSTAKRSTYPKFDIQTQTNVNKNPTSQKMTASRRNRMCTQKQDTCMQKYIFMTSTLTRLINKPQPQISACKMSKANYLNTPTPPKINHTPTNAPKTQNTPKASQTAELNCPNFKLAVPPHKLDHTQNPSITRSQ